MCFPKISGRHCFTALISPALLCCPVYPWPRRCQAPCDDFHQVRFRVPPESSHFRPCLCNTYFSSHILLRVNPDASSTILICDPRKLKSAVLKSSNLRANPLPAHRMLSCRLGI